MGDIEKLLEVDAENILNSRRILINFDPELSLALDTAAGMFMTFSRCIEGEEDSNDILTIQKCSEEMGMNQEKLVELIEHNTKNSNPTLDRARSAWFRLYGRRVRCIIFLLLQRQFMWGATDLLRMRITPAIGYTRLEAESLALLLIMKRDTNVADSWMKLSSDEAGKAFYKKFQGQIIRELKKIGLDGAYEMGSGTSLHVRFVSAVRKLSFKNRPGKSEIYLGYQELEANNGFSQFSYFLSVLSFLRTQECIFRALGDAFPEVTDPIWFTRVHIFAKTIDSLWRKFEKAFPNECKKYKQQLKERS